MAIILSNAWMDAVLDLKQTFLNEDATRAPRIRLFKNPVPATLDCSTVLGDFTTANFGGYADQVLNDWQPPASVGGCRWRILHPFVQWTPTNILTPNTVYGYAVFDNTSGALWFFEVFVGGPITVGGDLVPFLVFPRLDERSIP